MPANCPQEFGLGASTCITSPSSASSVSRLQISALHQSNSSRQDVPSLIRYPSRTSPAQLQHHHSTYRFATILTLPLLASLLLFWSITRRTASSVLSWEILPNLYLLYLIAAFLLPTPIARHGRARFLSILRRISIGGIAEASEGKFGDILAADVLTSYAKVFGDLFVALCMMLNRRHSTARPDRSCGGLVFVPLLICVPSGIRLRQCLTEYWRVRRVVNAGGGVSTAQARELGWGGQHLANALKYATAFPVTVLSAMQHSDGQLGMSEATLYNLWYARHRQGSHFLVVSIVKISKNGTATATMQKHIHIISTKKKMTNIPCLRTHTGSSPSSQTPSTPSTGT